jgi:hypothetical protein
MRWFGVSWFANKMREIEIVKRYKRKEKREGS